MADFDDDDMEAMLAAEEAMEQEQMQMDAVRVGLMVCLLSLLPPLPPFHSMLLPSRLIFALQTPPTQPPNHAGLRGFRPGHVQRGQPLLQ